MCFDVCICVIQFAVDNKLKIYPLIDNWVEMSFETLIILSLQTVKFYAIAISKFYRGNSFYTINVFFSIFRIF